MNRGLRRITKGGSLHCTFFSVIRSEKSPDSHGSKPSPVLSHWLFRTVCYCPIFEPLLTDTFAQCHRPQILFSVFENMSWAEDPSESLRCFKCSAYNFCENRRCGLISWEDQSEVELSFQTLYAGILLPFCSQHTRGEAAGRRKGGRRQGANAL